MSTTTTWGSHTIVNPSEFPAKLDTIGSESGMDDGGLKKEVIANKWRNSPKWERLSAAATAALYAAYLAYQVNPGGLFTFPDGAAFIMVGDDWNQVPKWYQAEDVFRYDVTFTLRQV